MNEFRVTETDESTDALFDVTPRAMAERFGARARLLIQRGGNPREAARLAASYAFRVDPSLRTCPLTTPLSDHLWRLALELNAAARERGGDDTALLERLTTTGVH